MRSLFIILVAKAFRKNTSFGHRGKERDGQELVPETTVKAFAEPVLPGMSWLDVVGLRLLTCQPGAQGRRDELRPVVAAQVLRRAMLGKETRKRRDSTAITLAEGSELPTSIARHSRVKSSPKSSPMVKIFSVVPLWVASKRKS
jgi:hypothetical protein